MYVDETYANDDGTDSWCSTDAVVPFKIFQGQSYPVPLCNIWTCGLCNMQSTYASYIMSDSGYVCEDRTLYHPAYSALLFACM